MRIKIQDVVKAILADNSTSHITWIFVSQQAQSPLEVSSLQTCRDAATQKGFAFFSVFLERHAGNDERVNTSERSDQKDDDSEVDVTNLTPTEAAQTLYEYLGMFSNRFNQE